MNPTDYLKNVLITKSSDYDAIRGRINPKVVDLLHSGLGWSSELAELVDAAYVGFPKDIDYVNVAEELGDVLWYSSVAIDALGLDPESLSEDEGDAIWGDLKPNSYTDLETSVAAIVYASGQFNDLIKKHLFYGREFDVEKAKNYLRALNRD